jgi:hypothetical protein
MRFFVLNLAHRSKYAAGGHPYNHSSTSSWRKGHCRLPRKHPVNTAGSPIRGMTLGGAFPALLMLRHWNRMSVR